jgi:dynactin complex subunit
MDIEAPAETSAILPDNTVEMPTKKKKLPRTEAQKKAVGTMMESLRAKRQEAIELKEFARQEEKALEAQVKQEILARREAEKLRKENEVKELREEVSKLRELITASTKNSIKEPEPVRRNNRDTFNTMFLRNY